MRFKLPNQPDPIAEFHRVRYELIEKNGGDISAGITELLERFCVVHRKYLSMLNGSKAIYRPKEHRNEPLPRKSQK